MIRLVKEQTAITAILVVVFAATPATFLAQTAEVSAVEKTDTGPVANEAATTPAPDVAVEIEMQWEFKELWKYLGAWMDSIDSPLGVLGVVLGILGIVRNSCDYCGVFCYKQAE